MNLLGPRGESQAAAFLAQKGYRILERNYRCRMGEIDLVAMEQETLCFVEVKARTRPAFSDPLESVTATKQRRIIRAANLYLQAKNLAGRVACRFDVVTIVEGGTPRLYKDAFQAG